MSMMWCVTQIEISRT